MVTLITGGSDEMTRILRSSWFIVDDFTAISVFPGSKPNLKGGHKAELLMLGPVRFLMLPGALYRVTPQYTELTAHKA